MKLAVALLAAMLLAGCPDGHIPDDGTVEVVDRIETLYERYVEHYDSGGPIETWLYDSEALSLIHI